MTVEIRSCSVDEARAVCDARERGYARRTYGAPFVAAPVTHALLAVEGESAAPAGALIFTIAGGVAEIDAIAFDDDSSDRDRELIRRFEDAASYNNCHKMIARVKCESVEQAKLERCGFRVAAVVERHLFQSDFVDMVKWLA